MNDKNKMAESASQQSSTQDDTSVQQTSNNPNSPQQSKVNKIDNNTKLENEADAGDLNDDD